ncbi:MAG: 30S ribosomal protein S16 [Patescibacteria group bacterium]
MLFSTAGLTLSLPSVTLPRMLMIRLQRVGRKHEPVFRVVLTESKNSTKSGKFTEILGSHDSRFDKTTLKADRIKYWLSVGARLTPTMHNLLISQKILQGKKINVLPKKTVAPKEVIKEEVKKQEKVEEIKEVKKEAEEIAGEETKEEEVIPVVAE